jgi:hypothetical protein
VAHVDKQTANLNANGVSTIRRAIPLADRDTVPTLTQFELASFIERLQEDIQTGVDRLIDEGMISTFTAARELSIMFPAYPGESPTRSKIIFLNTQDQEDTRDDLLSRLNESGRYSAPRPDDRYDRSVLMSALHGTEGSELQSYRDVLARIRPRFDPLLNLEDASNVPTNAELTNVYSQLSRLSHQMICVVMVRQRVAAVLPSVFAHVSQP